jgi:LysR family transcriptional regulator, positive regulator for ilvC
MPRPEHLPLELLQTFALIADLDGDATTAAERLDISQPSISKRLAALRRATTDPNGQPWLFLKGKRWRLTAEGQRVRSVVADLVRRYEQMEQFVGSGREGKSLVSIACGQQAATGFVRIAVERFLREHGDCRLRISTPRGKSRIEGVAGGQFDFALVTDSPATIRRYARRELFVETLFEDRLVLAANPRAKSTWAATWNSLPADRPAPAAALAEMPFILPESDASRRQQFDEWCFRATAKPLDVVLETGGWQTILDFAESGIGVAVATQTAIEAFQARRHGKLAVRLLDERAFPADSVRLIARKAHGKEEPELTDLAGALRQMLHEGADSR